MTGHPSQAIAAFQAVAAAMDRAAAPQATHVLSSEGSIPTAFLDAELPASIVHSMQVQATRGGGEARINLNPGFLGQLTVGIQVDGASVVASLHASNAEVREWIRTNEAMLRQALAEQGFNLDRLVVVDDEPAESSGDRSRSQHDDPGGQPKRQPRRPEPGGFEALI